MTSSELPDDVTRWPADPYDVLGISRGDDLSTVKRSYTRLLRRFKPEKFPTQFQRLRAAYDEVLSRLEQQAWTDAATDFSFPVARGAEGSAPTANSGRDANKRLRRQVTTRSAGEIAWEEAIAGQTNSAYQRLRTSVESQASCGQAWTEYAQLYWLLRLYPELDRATAAQDWLVAGQLQAEQSPQLLVLYEREIERDPDEAFTARFESLLSQGAADVLPRLLEIRWLAAQRTGQTEIILRDLSSVRSRLAFDREVEWCRMILLAADHGLLAKGIGSGPLKPFLDELRMATHVHRRLERELDRLDSLLALAHGWRWIEGISFLPGSWLDLLRQCWFLSDEPWQLLAERVVAHIATSPQESLDRLDDVRKQCSEGAHVLYQQVVRYSWNRSVEENRPSQPPRYWPMGLSSAAATGDRQEFRRRLLKYSLEEAIPPVTVLELALERGLELGTDPLPLVESVAQDVNLRCVYTAWRAFWD